MNISVLGCGWLGLPLAKKLLAEGHTVKGSTTNRDKMASLTAEGIIPFRIQIFEEGVQGDLTSFLSDAEILIIDIPPGTRQDPETNFVGKTGRLKEFIERSPVKHVLFVSSTSVYEDTEAIPEYTEDDPANGTSPNSLQLRGAETLLKKCENCTVSIVRFGGLIGPGRHPVKYLAGRKNIANPGAPVNLIHQEDCIGIILAIIEKNAWGDVFNAVNPEHPSKEEYYRRMAADRNLAIPEFDTQQVSKGKIIRSVKVEEELGYIYQQGIYE